MGGEAIGADLAGGTAAKMQSVTWDGDAYQRRFDELASSGADVHGEAAFVLRFGPRSVLDAGCGTGRVAIELARRGVAEVVGVDVDASMLATARQRAPELTWIEGDLTTLDVGRSFDVVVLAGNVPLFTPEGTQPALFSACAAHVASGGVLVAGFQLGRGYGADDLDRDCRAGGLDPLERWSTWDRAPFPGAGDYVVAVYGRPAGSMVDR
jgi:SAM-dependent methyltransferase